MAASLLFCLPILLAAIWRVIKDKNRRSWIVLALAVAYVTVFFMGCLRFFGVLPTIDDRLTNNAIGYIVNFMGGSVMTVVAACFSVLHIFIACAIAWRMRPWYFIIAMVCGYLLVGVMIPYFFDLRPTLAELGHEGMSPILGSLFGMCCATMAGIGWALGLTYKGICVLGNNWLQSLMVVASAAWMLWQAIKAVRQKGSASNILATLLAFVITGAYIILMLWFLVVKYPLTLDAAFDASVKDLYSIAAALHTNYYMVNIMLYIVGFLAAIIANIVAGRMVKAQRLVPLAVVIMVLHCLALAAIAAMLYLI